ncbi:hypothetical protein CsSME_00013771 [Camellia sinensis var. sinensis]
MTVFHFFNCAILTFGPHAVYYSATPLSEYDTLGTSVKAAVVYLGTALVKLVCLATFLKVSENDSFDPYQVLSGFFFYSSIIFSINFIFEDRDFSCSVIILQLIRKKH